MMSIAKHRYLIESLHCERTARRAAHLWSSLPVPSVFICGEESE
jgi:hypothetical protein